MGKIDLIIVLYFQEAVKIDLMKWSRRRNGLLMLSSQLRQHSDIRVGKKLFHLIKKTNENKRYETTLMKFILIENEFLTATRKNYQTLL